jgi:hypothetical protein
MALRRGLPKDDKVKKKKPSLYDALYKSDPLSGFLYPADAIVPCKVCGVAEGIPCRTIRKDKVKLKPGFVHFGRRVSRLLLTAKAPHERDRLEDEAVKLLREYLAEAKR